ncbi:MAG TPA: aminodeoxychorismate/anthranilate synthase component II [Gammaproteobacteria bacterium]|nr:aminodeoxychorismate/anthranilate synthase component II [Gammaproteobacteria bacterium]
MILIIDNYDSFVYNLARYVSELNFAGKVIRNNKITLDEISELNPSHIIISPGPCTPDQAGISLNVIRYFGESIPILGVCLGHQAIGQVYGGKVTRAKNPMHGKSSQIQHDEKEIFLSVENPLRAARYHSLIVSDEKFPDVLEVTARCDKGEIMAIRHREFPVFGVQFHPESVLSVQGHVLLKNFLNI